ncbi:MAG: flagellin lysine-N-methylase [Clostridiaceae bacterium]
MNKEMDTLRISDYDKFKCTADKCRFTCCVGWDISVDNDTYNKWKKDSDKLDYALKNTKIQKSGRNTEYIINKATDEVCPLLDEHGLCEIVKSHGEECLSLTCQRFPRIENFLGDKKELTLSCACPEAVEIISGISGKTTMVPENDASLNSDLLELKIRETLVNIVQFEKFSLEERLLVGFQMLLTILENECFEEDSLLEELQKYESKEYIQELIEMYHEIEFNINNSVKEINNLFLDITLNYKEVTGLKILLKDIFNYAEKSKVKNLSAKWHNYKSSFEQYNNLLENCIVSKILSSCVSDDVEEMASSFQMIILEYLLVRYSVFLKYSINEALDIDIEDIKDYIVAFSRIIGNNSEAVEEFFEDSFGDYLLEKRYLCFITLF